MIVEVPGGIAIKADMFDLTDEVKRFFEGAALCVADPPYGKIVSDKWDQIGPHELKAELVGMASALEETMLPGSHMCIWGGFGKPHNRPFFLMIPAIEDATGWQMAAFNTWRKKRAYGTKWRCLAAREEMARFVLGDANEPRVYHKQFEAEKRGYPGFNKRHPAKSDFKRLTMVWDHASDMQQNKPSKCYKPRELAVTEISMCTDPGDLVLDLFAGSAEVSLTARDMGRPFVAVENDAEEFDSMIARLRDERHDNGEQ